MTKQQALVLGLFFLLVVLCGGLLIASDFLSNALGGKLADVAADSFKIVVSALVGALSATIGGRKENG